MHKEIIKRVTAYINNFISDTRKEISKIRIKLKTLQKTNMSLGKYHYYNNDIFDAKLRFRLIIMFKPDAKNIEYNLARCYCKKGDSQKAVELLKKADKNEEVEFYFSKINSEKITYVPFRVIAERQFFKQDDKDYIQDISTSIKKLEVKTVLDIGCWLADRKSFELESDEISGIDFYPLIEEKIEEVDNYKIYHNKISSDVIPDMDKKYDLVIAMNILGSDNKLNGLKKLLSFINEEGYVLCSYILSEKEEPGVKKSDDIFSFPKELLEKKFKSHSLSIVSSFIPKGKNSSSDITFLLKKEKKSEE